MQEMQVQFLDWEDPLEKEMVTHSGILAWEVPWTEEPGRLQSMGSQKNQTGLSKQALSLHSSKEFACQAGNTSSIPRAGRCPGEGNDNPLRYSCLENPMDRGAWQATVHGVTKESDMTEQLSTA